MQDHKSRPISVYCHSAQLWRLLFTPRSFESGTSPNLMGTVAKATFLCPPHLKGSTLFMLDLGAPNDPYIWYENSHLFPKSTQEVLYIGCGRKDIPSMCVQTIKKDAHCHQLFRRIPGGHTTTRGSNAYAEFSTKSQSNQRPMRE